MKLDFMIELLAATITTALQSKLVDVLQDLHDSNEADYNAAIAGGNALVNHLKPITLKSKTKIDDMVVTALTGAIAASAALNSVDLAALAAPASDTATS